MTPSEEFDIHASYIRFLLDDLELDDIRLDIRRAVSVRYSTSPGVPGGVWAIAISDSAREGWVPFSEVASLLLTVARCSNPDDARADFWDAVRFHSLPGTWIED